MGFTVRISDPRSKFSAAHFLYQHDKCSRLHGHNYAVNVEVSGELNQHFFVVDFYELKAQLNEIIQELDHAVLIPTESKEIIIEHINQTTNTEIQVKFNGKRYIFPSCDVRLLPLPATTAELLSQHIFNKLKIKFDSYKLQVEVAESEGSVAIYKENC